MKEDLIPTACSTTQGFSLSQPIPTAIENTLWGRGPTERDRGSSQQLSWWQTSTSLSSQPKQSSIWKEEAGPWQSQWGQLPRRSYATQVLLVPNCSDQ